MKIALIIILVLSGMIIGLSALLGPDNLAECELKPSGSTLCQPADAIVAISGGDTAARADEAIRLYKNGWAEKLIFSGAAQDKSGPSNAEVMKTAALTAGVPPNAIIIETEGETTRQNAEKTQNIFEENQISTVILVTSAYHQRRAGLEFEKNSAGMVNVRNHPVPQDNQWSGLWWLTPVGWYLAVSETIKVLLFYVGGTR